METYFVYSKSAPRVTSLYQVKWTLLPVFLEWGLADCLQYVGLMKRRKQKLPQTYLLQHYFVNHKLYAEYFGTEPRLPSWKAGDWLAAFAIKVPIGQLSGTPIFLPQYQAKGLVICNDFEVNSFPILMSSILQPTFFIVFGALVELYSREKTELLGQGACPSATSSTTNPTWTGLGSNAGLRSDRPAS